MVDKKWVRIRKTYFNQEQWKLLLAQLLKFTENKSGGLTLNTVDAIKSRILQLCGQNDLTINGLADLCGIPPSSVKNILYGKSMNPKIATIKMICDGLGITLSQFFDTPEFNSLEQDIR